MKVILLAVATTTIMGLSAPLVNAQAPTNDCKVTKAGVRNGTAKGGQFTLNKDGTVTGSFTVQGKNCAVSMASWQAPSVKGTPYADQKLFDSKTAKFSNGVHTLTVKLPNCFYQIDLVPGASATDSQGGPEYFTNGGRHVIGSLHGGNTACTTPTAPAPTPTPPSTPAATTLPNTGNGLGATIAAVFGSSLVGGLIYRKRLLTRED